MGSVTDDGYAGVGDDHPMTPTTEPGDVAALIAAGRDREAAEQGAAWTMPDEGATAPVPYEEKGTR